MYARAARRGTDAWNVAMQDALGQALGYARCFDRSHVWSPFPNAQQLRIDPTPP
jgi:hypothetical protein